ncbi:MAG: DNA polymerase ligase N-terminal domain-containing protein [Patescibacteria group bacterium]|nr:DNA polymerase ligase N-terminal domain-containing protein [Patescibacteria group bacterium]
MLEKYQEKRNFQKTPEPRGKAAKSKDNRFVIQQHRARTLHYDVRLEVEGVLKSWAVPKNLPLSLGEKHLAIKTEDHPVQYLTFEGIIPEGNYGAGVVQIWDQGKFKLESREPRKLVFYLRGKKLTGKYVLVKIGKQPKKGKNWLVFKIKA